MITKLPLSKEPMTSVAYDSIWTITDLLTKYTYFVPFKESSSAEQLAYMFQKTIVATHGIPETIISDRGTTYTSKFWQTLTAQLGIKHKCSTAFHPQTDGQTERMNQTVEQYLRAYINYDQSDWVQHLPMAQYAYNNAENRKTGMTPFFANYGQEPRIRGPQEGKSLSIKAIDNAKALKGLHKRLQEDTEFFGINIGEYYDKKHEDMPPWKEGDKVYLRRKNIQTK